MVNTFELEHIGINCHGPKDAAALAERLGTLFHFPLRHGRSSEFAGSYFECVKEPSHGTNGHIALRTQDLTEAVEELKSKGVAFKMETATYYEDGRLKNIYLDGEFGGFSIHIIEK